MPRVWKTPIRGRSRIAHLCTEGDDSYYGTSWLPICGRRGIATYMARVAMKDDARCLHCLDAVKREEIERD